MFRCTTVVSSKYQLTTAYPTLLQSPSRTQEHHRPGHLIENNQHVLVSIGFLTSCNLKLTLGSNGCNVIVGQLAQVQIVNVS